MIQNVSSALRFSPSNQSNSLFSLISLWKSRRALTKMDEYMLRDIGLTPEKASVESKRGFWDVPCNWRG